LPYKKDTTDPLTRLLRSYFTATGLAQVLGVSRQTAAHKLHDPGRLTVKDLRKLTGHVPKERMKELI